MQRLRTLRLVTVSILVVLAFQFELGMAVNLSPNLQAVAPLRASFQAVWSALSAVGGEALTHAVLGSVLAIVALAELVLALRTGVTSVAIIGAFSFASIALAAITGVLFTVSGFQNDGYSHGMATSFLVTFTMHFVQVCALSVKVRTAAAARP